MPKSLFAYNDLDTVEQSQNENDSQKSNSKRKQRQAQTQFEINSFKKPSDEESNRLSLISQCTAASTTQFTSEMRYSLASLAFDGASKPSMPRDKLIHDKENVKLLAGHSKVS